MKRSIPKESSSVVAGIMGFLSEHGKSNLLSSVTQILDETVEKSRKADKIMVASAVPLTKPELAKIRTIVSDFLRKPLPITNQVEPKLLGGFSIRVGDFFLDATLAGELLNIKHILTA